MFSEATLDHLGAFATPGGGDARVRHPGDPGAGVRGGAPATGCSRAQRIVAERRRELAGRSDTALLQQPARAKPRAAERGTRTQPDEGFWIGAPCRRPGADVDGRHARDRVPAGAKPGTFVRRAHHRRAGYDLTAAGDRG